MIRTSAEIRGFFDALRSACLFQKVALGAMRRILFPVEP